MNKEILNMGCGTMPDGSYECNCGHCGESSALSTCSIPEYQTANAPCGFCGGEMPCYCEPTYDVDKAMEEDDEARDRVGTDLMRGGD